MTTLWQLDTRWACGGVIVKDGIIVDGAPIFRKLLGQRLVNVLAAGRSAGYRAMALGQVGEPEAPTRIEAATSSKEG